MILAFSQQLNNRPTLFVEKILNSMHFDLKTGNELNDFLVYEKYGYQDSHTLINTVLKQKSKKHTIRKDTSNRWKAGNDIHFSINVRTKNQVQFAPVVKCVSTQKIEINWKDGDGYIMKAPTIWVDNRWIVGEEEEQLAINDGFNSIEDFYKYFNTDFTGKIIHWTNLKY